MDNQPISTACYAAQNIAGNSNLYNHFINSNKFKYCHCDLVVYLYPPSHPPRLGFPPGLVTQSRQEVTITCQHVTR